jgi:ribonuclease P protein component
MLPRTARLTRSRDFAAVYARRRRFESVELTLSILQKNKTEEASPPRLGFVVSKKTAARAHDRNFVKRRLRAICQLRLPQLAENFDGIFTVRPGALQLSYLELEGVTLQLLERAGVYAKER